MADDTFDPDEFEAHKAAQLPTITVKPGDDTFDPGEFAASKPAPLTPLQNITKPVTDIPSEIRAAGQEGAKQFGTGVSQLESGDPWEMAKGVGNTLLGAYGYTFAPVSGTIHSLVGQPVENVTGSPTAGDLADLGASFLLPVPKEVPRLRAAKTPEPPVEEPFGVTLSEGQSSGDLPTQRVEQEALRNRSGEPAYQRAQTFAGQQKEQVEAAKDIATSQLGPTGTVLAKTPAEAGDIASAALQAKETQRSAIADQEGEALRPKGMIHPFDAADTVADALRNSANMADTAQKSAATALQADGEAIRSSLSPNGQILASSPTEAADIISAGITRAQEQAVDARDAAYDKFANLPGSFRPQAFVNIGNDIRRTFNDPKDPFITNEKTTPNTLDAIKDLDENLGASARVAADPNTQSFAPFTPSRIDDVRKKLGAYWRAANNSARATNDYSDVDGMSRVMDGFDDVVSNALKRKRLFDGDGKAIGQAWDDALASHRYLRQTFSSQGRGDTVGPIINKIVGQREGQAAPADQIANWTMGSGAGTPTLVGRRLLSIFGPNSTEIGAAKQGLWSKAVDPVEGMPALDAVKKADNIDKLRSSELGRTYFSPGELTRMRQYAVDLRNSVPEDRAPTDVVGKAIEKINGVGGQPWTSQEFAQKLFGRNGGGDDQLGVKLAQHVKNVYGEDSPEFRALQRGQLAALMKAQEGKAGFDPKELAGDVRDFVNGGGKSMADTLYNADHKASLLNYADRLDDYAKRTAIPDDPVEQKLARITGRDGMAPATGREVAAMLFGATTPSDKATALGLVRRLKQELTPEQFATIKQGGFRQAIEPGLNENGANWTSARVVKNIANMLNNAPELMKEVYTPDDMKVIKDYQNLHQKLIPQQAALQSSNHPNYIRAALRAMAFATAESIMSGTVGYHPGVNEAAAYGAQHFFGQYMDSRAARKVAKLMPMAGDRMAQYQKALVAAQRTKLPVYEQRAAIIGSQLAKMFNDAGVDLSKFQGPSVTRAQEQQGQQQKNVPGVKDQQRDGGSVDTKAHGGAVRRDSSDVAKPEFHPVIKAARKAPDGYYYLSDPNRPGKFLRLIERGRRPAA